MVTKIINGVSQALKKQFGDSMKVYSDVYEQGQSGPCFFIAVEEVSQSKMIGGRFIRKHQMDIRYLPAVKGSNNEILLRVPNLFDCLEFVSLSETDILMGTQMRYAIKDGILHFYVNYDMHLVKQKEEAPLLSEATTESKLKG